jgi:hypothetical protein
VLELGGAEQEGEAQEDNDVYNDGLFLSLQS